MSISRVAPPTFPESPIDADILRISAGPAAVHVARYGHGGEPIVLLHGFGTSSFVWRAVAALLAERAHTVYAIDFLGYGESDRPFDADYSLTAQSEYIDRALSALRVAPATIVGLDIGGGVAQRLAVDHPARVKRLALVNSVAFDQCPGGDVRKVQTGTARFAIRVARGVLGVAPLLRPVLEASVADRAAMPQRLVARYLAPYVGTEGVTHLLTLARSISPADLEGLDLGTIKAPTLIVWGEAEPWIDSTIPERLQAAIPDSALVRLPGVGRLVPEEAPDALTDLLLGLVARAGSGVP